MRLFVYCGAKSQGAYELVQALEGTRIRQFDGMDFWRKGKRVKLADDDVIVCWGRSIPEIDGVKILNSSKNLDKADQAALLSNAGVRTIQAIEGGRRPGDGWLPRSNSHIGGNDLLNPTDKPDFWVKKMNLVKEYRVHSFAERSIRAGLKVPRDGFEVAPDEATYQAYPMRYAHPWIRSYDAGWKINYSEFQSTGSLRKLAHTSVKALGLTFGAVDIGLCDDGKEYVLEVNKAPGIEGGTLEAYVRAIVRWTKGAKEEVEKPAPVVAPAPNSVPRWFDELAPPPAHVVVPTAPAPARSPNDYNPQLFFRNINLREEAVRPAYRVQWGDPPIANLGVQEEEE